MPGITAHICYTLRHIQDMPNDKKMQIFKNEDIIPYTQGKCKDWKIWKHPEILQNLLGKILAASILPDVLKAVYGIDRAETHYSGENSGIKYSSLNELKQKLEQEIKQSKNDYQLSLKFDEIEEPKRFLENNQDLPQDEKMGIYWHLSLDRIYSLLFQKATKIFYERNPNCTEEEKKNMKQKVENAKYQIISFYDKRETQEAEITPSQLEQVKETVIKEYKDFPNQEIMLKFLEYIKWPEEINKVQEGTGGGAR